MKKLDPITAAGLFVTLLLHGGGVAGVILYRQALAATEAPPPTPSYVVATLVRKGRRKNPKHLPKKVVPRPKATPTRKIDLSADANAPANPKRPKRAKPKRRADTSTSAFDKLDLLAKAQQETETEGDPEGVEGGAAQSRSGDLYMTRVADLWNRTWSLPAVIPRDRAQKLYVLIVLRIDRNGQIRFPIQIDRRSGNPHFDNSIIVAWRQIKQLPIPPPDRLAAVMARGLALKLTWRGLQ